MIDVIQKSLSGICVNIRNCSYRVMHEFYWTRRWQRDVILKVFFGSIDVTFGNLGRSWWKGPGCSFYKVCHDSAEPYGVHRALMRKSCRLFRFEVMDEDRHGSFVIGYPTVAAQNGGFLIYHCGKLHISTRQRRSGKRGDRAHYTIVLMFAANRGG
uniref:TMV resistance protein N-like n=1 Tax=Ascaris lumbricoides TaxID=6252 RepID=A0A0M3IX40_ASCLU